MLALVPQVARASVTLCLEVRSDADGDGLRKLVEDELGHHPSHRVVAEGCESRLTVEMFAVAGTRYLTARINQEVPVRFAVKPGHDVADKLADAIGQVLKHDPVYLAEDMSHMNAVMRTGALLVRNGVNRYRGELFEVVGSAGKSAVFASGGSFAVTRGIDHFAVFARLSLAGSTANGHDIALRVLAGGELGFVWEASARANATFYLGPGASLHYLRFEANQLDDQGKPISPVGQILFSLALRMGVRVLRFYGFDADLFAQVHLPLHKTHDPDSSLVDGWTPYGSIGVGVGF
jgi:hypothetical protein